MNAEHIEQHIGGDGSAEDMWWWAYVHLFDADGHHLRSEFTRLFQDRWLRGELGERARAALQALLAQLGDVRFGDIAIRPLRLDHQGVTFGLIDESDAERGRGPRSTPTGSASTRPSTAPTAPDRAAGSTSAVVVAERAGGGGRGRAGRRRPTVG